MGLHKVAVGLVVGPLPLPLEAAHDGVAAQRFLVEAHFAELGVALHNVAADDGHLADEFPFRFLLLRRMGPRVVVVPGLAVGLGPGQRLLVFLLIVDAQIDAAEDFAHIHPLGADAEILLHQIRVEEGTGNAHGHRTNTHIGFVAHGRHRDGRLGETENFFLHIGGDRRIVHVLHIVAIDAESRQAALGVGGHDGGQIYRAGRSVPLKPQTALMVRGSRSMVSLP